MKPSKILTLALGISGLNILSNQDTPSAFKQNLSTQILKDTRSIRNVRHYKQGSRTEKQAYDNKVAKISDCFADSRTFSDKWNETQAILDIHDCSLKNDYPNIIPLDERWEAQVKYARNNDKHIQLDNLGNHESIIEHITAIDNKKIKEQVAEAKFEFNISDLPLIHGNPVIHIDNKQIAQLLIAFSKNQDIEFHVARSSIIKTQSSDTLNDNLPPKIGYYKYLSEGGTVVTSHLDKIANNLLDGNFKNQQDATESLLDYKILSSLVFAIEDQKGTQFKNIVKMNYLTETIKEKYPKIIASDFTIPHIIDHKAFDDAAFLKNPEIAVTILPLDIFKNIQKKQIASNYWHS